MSIAYLSLGSNIGDKIRHLKDAMRKIDEINQTKLMKASKFYETPPWGYEQQDSFINICVEIETDLSPMELLENLQKIESDLKRERLIHWGPRTIDIDILLFDDILSKEERLILPHPRMEERAFVIVPLYEINSALTINGKHIKNILEQLDISEIKELKA